MVGKFYEIAARSVNLSYGIAVSDRHGGQSYIRFV